MDTSRQVLRWSIPGWVFVFLLIVFAWVLLRVTGTVNFQVLLSSVATQKYGVESAALLAAAGIPLGFIIYQIYFFMYGTVLPFYLVNIDRGIDIFRVPGRETLNPTTIDIHPETLKRITIDIGVALDVEEMTEEFRIRLLHAPLHRLKREHRNPAGKRKYEARLQNHWEIVRYYLTRISANPKSSDISKEFTTLSDIYHSLGASRIAVLLAYLASITYVALRCLGDANSIWRLHLARTGQGILYITLIFGFLNSVLTRNRDKALISSQSFLRHTYYTFFRASEQDESRSSQVHD